MDDKIVELQDKRFVCNDLVELLENILDETKKGIIVAGGFVVVNCDSTSGNAFAGSYPGQLLSESLILQREIIDCQVNLRMHEAGTQY